MKYGNCLTGAALLMWKERKNNPRFMLKTRPGTKVPHFMVKSDLGLHHYRVSEDILPWPLCYIVFRGRFQTVQQGRGELRQKTTPLIFAATFVAGCVLAYAVN